MGQPGMGAEQQKAKLERALMDFSVFTRPWVRDKQRRKRKAPQMPGWLKMLPLRNGEDGAQVRAAVLQQRKGLWVRERMVLGESPDETLKCLGLQKNKTLGK